MVMFMILILSRYIVGLLGFVKYNFLISKSSTTSIDALPSKDQALCKYCTHVLKIADMYF